MNRYPAAVSDRDRDMFHQTIGRKLVQIHFDLGDGQGWCGRRFVGRTKAGS